MDNITVYVAPPTYQTEVLQELSKVNRIEQNLIFSSEKKYPCFAEDIWFNPVIVNFDSINDAAKILREANTHWYLYPLNNVRRSKLIEEKLRRPFKRRIPFSIPTNYPDTGVFCLLDKNTLLYSTKRWKKIPFGVVEFVEDKVNPPNRAYLKLWEILSLLNKAPHPGENAIDLGASPGGWSYVLAMLDAQVVAVDKAALEPRLYKNKNISYLNYSAFALNPESMQHFDWLFSDIACYPERLYELVQRWIESGKATHLICTIKLQGETDFEMIKKFQSIPNSEVLHLFYNKHEVTFVHPKMSA